MRFPIGPWEYRVEISSGPLYDETGSEAAGLCAWLDNVVKISGEIPLERRADVLLHELHHAWQHHLGRPQGEEGDANSTASFTMMCITHLEKQGGERALMAMTPEPEPVAAIETTPPSSDSSRQTWAQASPDGGTECGWCGRRFSPGEIVTEEHTFHPLTGKMIVPRSVYCEGCAHVLVWHEGTLFDQSPNGQVIGLLRRLKGADAVEWLRTHGEQVGVLID